MPITLSYNGQRMDRPPLRLDGGRSHINNLLLAFRFPAFLREGTIWSLEHAILDVRSLVPLLVYALALETVLVLLPLLFYRSRTPLAFYRRTLS